MAKSAVPAMHPAALLGLTAQSCQSLSPLLPSRFCLGGTCPKAHPPTEPLRLVFTLDDPLLTPAAAFAWAVAGVSLEATASNQPTLVIQPFTSAGRSVFPDGAHLTFNLTAFAGNLSALATISVDIARRPACTAPSGACLTAAPTSGAQDTAAFVLNSAGFVADEPLSFNWGRVATGGSQDIWSRGSQQASFTFPAGSLPAGNQTLFVCAVGETLP